jgi:hypothetical protein
LVHNFPSTGGYSSPSKRNGDEGYPAGNYYGTHLSITGLLLSVIHNIIIIDLVL